MDDEIILYNRISGSGCYSETVVANQSTHMCNIKSATRSEFYEAMRAGQKASLIIEVNEMEFNNEEYAKLNGAEKEYKIIRSFNIKEKEITELTLCEVV